MAKKLALCIGNNFVGTGNDLAGCVNDAMDWYALLVSKGFSVQQLMEKQATRSHVLAYIRDMLQVAVKGDSLVITNSSHGTQIPDLNGDEPDGMDEAVCVTMDNNPYDIDVIYDDEFWNLFRQKKPGVQIVMVSDSCHSGTVVRAVGAPICVPGGQRRFLPYQRLSENVQKRSHPKMEGAQRLVEVSPSPKVPWPVLLMAGCQDNEYSYDAHIGGRPCGAFTNAAMRTFKNMTPTSTYNDWFLAIRKILPSRDFPQTPRLIGSYIKATVLS
jgi:metacaspase-1